MTPFAWSPSTDRLELGSNEIHLWRAHLACDEGLLHRFEATLAPDEKARAGRFFFSSDRVNYVVTRGILRELLGRYANRAAAELEFEYSALGKPFLRGMLSEASIQFNVSHSHGLALLAFAEGRKVGVDVELIRPEFPHLQIAERYFAPEEVHELRGLPRSMQEEGFFLAGRVRRRTSRPEARGYTYRSTAFRCPSRQDSPSDCRV